MILAELDFTTKSVIVGLVIGVVIVLGLLAMIAKFYRKVSQGETLIRNGVSGTKVSFAGMIVIPTTMRLSCRSSGRAIASRSLGVDGGYPL